MRLSSGTVGMVSVSCVLVVLFVVSQVPVAEEMSVAAGFYRQNEITPSGRISGFRDTLLSVGLSSPSINQSITVLGDHQIHDTM